MMCFRGKDNLPWLHPAEFYTIASRLEARVVVGIKERLVLKFAVRFLDVGPALALPEVETDVLLLGFKDADVVLVEAERRHETGHGLVHLPLYGTLEARSAAALPGVVHDEPEERRGPACRLKLHLVVARIGTVFDNSFSIKDFNFESAASSIIRKAFASHTFTLVVKSLVRRLALHQVACPGLKEWRLYIAFR